MKQINTGKFLGLLILVFQQIGPYLNIFTFMFAGITAYEPISITLKAFGVELPFWLFLVIMTVAAVLLVGFVYLIILPSYFSSVNNQTWEHDNPIKKEFELLNEKIDRLDKEKK